MTQTPHFHALSHGNRWTAGSTVITAIKNWNTCSTETRVGERKKTSKQQQQQQQQQQTSLTHTRLICKGLTGCPSCIHSLLNQVHFPLRATCAQSFLFSVKLLIVKKSQRSCEIHRKQRTVTKQLFKCVDPSSFSNQSYWRHQDSHAVGQWIKHKICFKEHIQPQILFRIRNGVRADFQRGRSVGILQRVSDSFDFINVFRIKAKQSIWYNHYKWSSI